MSLNNNQKNTSNNEFIIKARNSDENLSNQMETEKEIDSVSGPIAEKRRRKMSALSIPVEVESEGEVNDEFLFIRLKKQIKNHWHKITERYPNGKFFFRPNLSGESISISQVHAHPNSPRSSSMTVESLERIKEQASNDLFTGGLFKSLILLPVYACKRDDEGRKTVPLISLLLQVS